MWAQLIRMQLKPGKDTAALDQHLRAVEQPGSGLLRRIVMHDQRDPSQAYVLVVFESEEKARAREKDPGRVKALTAIREQMAEILAAPPEFTDLTVTDEWTG